MKPTIAQLINAMRVPATLPCREAGLWAVRRLDVDAVGFEGVQGLSALLRLHPYRTMTYLTRITDSRLHLDPPWETVMDDSPGELRKHLPIVLKARGRVLVTGLGLGCVVRGLLANSAVEHIDVVEIDRSVHRLVGPLFRDESRVTLWLGDAETIRWPEGQRWDYAWHDCWTEKEALDLLHARLMARYMPFVGEQGAWGMKRYIQRAWPGRLVGAAR